MKNRTSMAILGVIFALFVGTALAQNAPTTSSTSSGALAGDLEKVSADGKSISVKTADGAEDVVKVTGKTTVDGSKEVGLAGKEGSHVVIHYTSKGAEKTATGVEDAGKGTWKVTEGVVTKVGEGGKDVTVKIKDGTEKTFQVEKEATVDTGHGIEKAGKYTGKAGDKIVVYTIVDPTNEVAHIFKKL
jgi:hypothetical protein